MPRGPESFASPCSTVAFARSATPASTTSIAIPVGDSRWTGGLRLCCCPHAHAAVIPRATVAEQAVTPGDPGGVRLQRGRLLCGPRTPVQAGAGAEHEGERSSLERAANVVVVVVVRVGSSWL